MYTSVKEARAAGDKFYFTGKPCKHGHVSKRYSIDSTCVDCSEIRGKSNNRKMYDKKHYAKNSSSWRDKQLMRTYNISLDQYNRMLAEQNNKCVICNTMYDQSGKSMAVDHCHTTGAIRGLLCKNCNTALGSVKDDINILQNMITYLQSTQIQTIQGL